MKAFLSRLVKEGEELRERKEKCQAFIKNNKIFKSLPFKKRILLRLQLVVMKMYYRILKARIKEEK